MLDLAGIPVESQVVVEGADGAIRVDFKVLGFAMILEANGHRTHSTRAALARDARRTRIAFDTESALVVFTFSEIFGQPANVQAELFAIAVKLGVRSGSRPAQP